jgi:hypothetical protein
MHDIACAGFGQCRQEQGFGHMSCAFLHHEVLREILLVLADIAKGVTGSTQ